MHWLPSLERSNFIRDICPCGGLQQLIQRRHRLEAQPSHDQLFHDLTIAS